MTLEPSSISALRHWHEAEDEFVYVLSGRVVLINDRGEHTMEAGTFAGFSVGCSNAHHLQNKFSGDRFRRPGEEVIHYPDDNIGPIRK